MPALLLVDTIVLGIGSMRQYRYRGRSHGDTQARQIAFQREWGTVTVTSLLEHVQAQATPRPTAVDVVEPVAAAAEWLPSAENVVRMCAVVDGAAGEVTSPASFAAHPLEHHRETRRAKPPNGRRAWFDTFGDGRVAIRPAYTAAEFAPQPATYVQANRSKPIWSFARDLGRVATPTESV